MNHEPPPERPKPLPVRLQVIGEHRLRPGAYLIVLDEGARPGDQLACVYDATPLVERARGAEAPTGINLEGVAEKLAPLIAQLAMRFM